jgi:hypothetical protein
MTTKAHLLVLVITFSNLVFILRLVRNGRLRAKYSILWLSVGGALVLLAASPPLLDRFAEAVGIDYGPAAFFLVAISFLFLIVVHFSWELSRLEERTRNLAEELALLRIEAVGPDRRRAIPPTTGASEDPLHDSPVRGKDAVQ